MNLLKSLVGLVVIILLVAGVWYFKNSPYYEVAFKNFSSFVEFIGNKLAIVKNNLIEEVMPSRRPPPFFSRQEEQLKAFLPDVFESFSPEDWRKFWDIIYSRKEVGRGLIKQKTYRSREEIEDYLIYNYPIFSNFRPEHWEYFWSIILGETENNENE